MADGYVQQKKGGIAISFFAKLFGKRDASKKEQIQKSFSEKDNMGTRHDILSLASSYWMACISSPKKDPFLLYTFEI
jgi:hypothetical protein